MDIDVVMPFAAGKASRSETVGKTFDPGDLDAPVVQVRAGPALCREHLLANGVVHHPHDGFARAFESEGYVENREAVREVRGAVQRINEPSILGRTLVPAAFLADNR